MVTSMSQGPAYGRLSDLIDAAAAVVGETDLDRVLRRLVAEAMSATGARYGALGVRGEHGALSDFLYEGMTPDLAAEIGHLPTGRGVLGTVIRLNKTIRLDHIRDHPDSFGFPEHHPPMENFLGVPLSVGDTAFGNLYLTEKDGGFSDEDVAVVEALSRIAGGAVKTARLHERLRGVAVLEDRQRIARDLHDSVIQEMFAVGLGLQGLANLVEDDQAEATLTDAVDRLDDAVERLRQYIFQLKNDHPGHDLDLRLQDIVSRMGSAYPARVRLSIDIGDEINDTLDEEIVAIVTEALSNALRHSGADAIRVDVSASDGSCTIDVDDNGHGFDPDAAGGGMGLANLRARAQRRGGRIAIDSSAAGTSLSVELPLS